MEANLYLDVDTNGATVRGIDNALSSVDVGLSNAIRSLHVGNIFAISVHYKI